MKQEKVMAQLEACTARLLSSRKDVENTYLFGSSARDDYNPKDGLDVLIVLSSDGRKWEDRISEFQGYFTDVSTVVDVFPLTKEEIEHAVGKKDGFIGQMLKDKIVIGNSK